MRCRCANRKVSAFTLVEIVGVVVIIGILVTVVTVVAHRSTDTALDSEARMGARAYNEGVQLLIAQGKFSAAGLSAIISGITPVTVSNSVVYGGGTIKSYALSTPGSPKVSTVTALLANLDTQLQTAGLGRLRQSFDSRLAKKHAFNLIMVYRSDSGQICDYFLEVK